MINSSRHQLDDVRRFAFNSCARNGELAGKFGEIFGADGLETRQRPMYLCFMLDAEFAYFLENQDKWSAEHHGKYVVVVGQEVFGFFEDMFDAYHKAKAHYPVGTFLIQLCIPGQESFTQMLFNNVAVV